MVEAGEAGGISVAVAIVILIIVIFACRRFIKICCCFGSQQKIIVQSTTTVKETTQPNVSIIQQAPVMSPMPVQTGNFQYGPHPGIHPSPAFVPGNNNRGFIQSTYAQGDPGMAYPPASIASPSGPAGYQQPQAYQDPLTQSAPPYPRPPPYGLVDPNSKQPAMNPGKY